MRLKRQQYAIEYAVEYAAIWNREFRYLGIARIFGCQPFLAASPVEMNSPSIMEFRMNSPSIMSTWFDFAWNRTSRVGEVVPIQDDDTEGISERDLHFAVASRHLR